MKRITTLIIIAVLAILARVEAVNTLHAISFCATNAENIAVGVRADRENFITDMSIIGDWIGYDTKFYDYAGNDCSKENLVKVVTQLQSKPNDIVVFYYSGHGARSKNDKSVYPQMCLKYNGWQEQNFVPVHYVQEQLAKQQGSLKIILSDCCNVTAPISSKGVQSEVRGATIADEEGAKYLKKLFLGFKGDITLTGSKVGTPSYGPDNGGIFSNSLWAVIFDGVATGKISPEWSAVKSATVSLTMRKTGNKQEPIGKVNVSATGVVNNTAVTTIQTVTPNPNPINATNSSFSVALQKMLSIQDEDARLNMLNTLNSYFGSKSRIQVVGRNMTTIVDTFDEPLSYLRWACMSDEITGIKIVDEQKDSSGKITYLKVHEIRKQ